MKKDYYSIILWRKPEREGISFNEVLDNTMALFDYIVTLPEWIKPTTTYSGKTPVKFSISRDTIKNKLLKGMDINEANPSKDLGYCLILFSDEDNEGSRITWTFRVGNADKFFSNCIVIEFNHSSFNGIENKEWQSVVSEVFKKLTVLFDVYYGSITNLNIANNYSSFADISTPYCVFSYNYWNKDMLEKIGRDKINHLVERGDIEFEEPGFVKLFNGFIDVNDEEQMKKRKEIEDYLLYNK